MTTQCPEPGCVSQSDTPEATGWRLVEDRHWCPLHVSGELRRRKKQQDEIDWYAEMIQRRERAVTEAEAELRANQFRLRRGPEARDHHAEIKRRANRAQEEIPVLRRNRDAASQRHELENDARRSKLQQDEDSSEK